MLLYTSSLGEQMNLKRFTGVAALCALGAMTLLAADFWAAKPFTEWNDKEVQKLYANSPWAKEYSIAMSGGAGADPSSTKGGGRRAGSGGPDADNGAAAMANALNLVIRWQSALPVKQAA